MGGGVRNSGVQGFGLGLGQCCGLEDLSLEALGLHVGFAVRVTCLQGSSLIPKLVVKAHASTVTATCLLIQARPDVG